MKQRRRLEITAFRRRTTVIRRERVPLGQVPLPERPRRASADQTQEQGDALNPSPNRLVIQRVKRRPDHEPRD